MGSEMCIRDSPPNLANLISEAVNNAVAPLLRRIGEQAEAIERLTATLSSLGQAANGNMGSDVDPPQSANVDPPQQDHHANNGVAGGLPAASSLRRSIGSGGSSAASRGGGASPSPWVEVVGRAKKRNGASDNNGGRSSSGVEGSSATNAPAKKKNQVTPPRKKKDYSYVGSLGDEELDNLLLEGRNSRRRELTFIYVRGLKRQPLSFMRTALAKRAGVTPRTFQNLSFVGEDVLEAVVFHDEAAAVIDKLEKVLQGRLSVSSTLTEDATDGAWRAKCARWEKQAGQTSNDRAAGFLRRMAKELRSSRSRTAGGSEGPDAGSSPTPEEVVPTPPGAVAPNNSEEDSREAMEQ